MRQGPVPATGAACACLLILALADHAPGQTAADSAWDAGDLDTARELYAERLANDSTDARALFRLALIHGWNQDHDRSLALLDRLLDVAPSDDARLARARVLAWANRFDQARGVYDRLLEEDPDNVRALLGLARLLSWTDRLDSARTVYRRVLELDDGSLEARAGLARTSGYAGEVREAERRWRAIVETDPDNVEARVGLGQALRWQGRDAAALPYLRHALELDPRSSTTRRELRLVRAALGPSVAPAFAYEWDSDDNAIRTLAGYGTWNPVPRFRLRIDLYRRAATLGTLIPEPRRTTGGSVTAQLHLRPGWRLAGSAGGTAPELAGVDATTTFAVVVATPPHLPLRPSLRIAREAVDYTAVLMANRVVYDQLRLNLGARLGRWTVQGAASTAWYESLGTSAGNRRLGATAAATRSVAPWLDLGGRFRAFGFDRDLNLGYFDPDLYALLEAPASASAQLGDMVATLSVAPGIQQVTTGGAPDPAFSTAAEVAWRPGPEREASVRVFYAANGASPFADVADDYRYFALNLDLRWVF